MKTRKVIAKVLKSYLGETKCADGMPNPNGRCVLVQLPGGETITVADFWRLCPGDEIVLEIGPKK